MQIARPGDVTDPSAAHVVRDLLRRGLVTERDAVEHGLSVTDASVSHVSYRIDVGGEPRLFAKIASHNRSLGRDLSVEAAVYRHAAREPVLAGVLPRPQYVSDDGSVVVLDAVPGAPLAMETVLDDGRRARAVLAAYGAAVATVHRVEGPAVGRPPWMLQALEPRWGGYAWLPEACRRLLTGLAADPLLVAGFRATRARWTASCLIHADLRGPNVLVDERGADGPSTRLVDWELACRGDPAWDIGCVLADVLASAVLAAPVDPADALVRGGARLLAGYRTASARDADDGWLVRSIPLSAVRLVGVLVEYAHARPEELDAAGGLLMPWVAELLAGAPWLVRALDGDTAWP